MPTFTPVASTVGGALIGLSASLMLLGLGRIAGISGIFGAVLLRDLGEGAFRGAFLLGLLLGGFAMLQLSPASFAVPASQPLGLMAVAGVLVGFGTRLGNGCTSGHGVCGLARLSQRSLVATLVFVATAAITVFLMRHVIGS